MGRSHTDNRRIGSRAKIALLWRGDPKTAQTPTAQNNRLYPLFKALADLGVEAEPIIYSDSVVDQVRAQLSQCDGVMVWVDPITESQNRSKLDPMLREVSALGVWVSAHPDVIQKIGTKEVLFNTRHFGWGSDTHLYSGADEFMTAFPQRLKSSGVRVVKQRRGNGGIGTWRVEWSGQPSDHDPMVRVREARRGGTIEEVRLSQFMRRCEVYFAEAGRLIDQAFQSRVAEGMVRCYLIQNTVAGFSTQMPSDESAAFAMARQKTMYEETEPRFQLLRHKMESEWVPALQKLFSIDATSLPVIWDADFLYGSRNSNGDDTYVLCEINVSAVFPFPETAVARIAEAAMHRALAAKETHTRL